jgi:hypothetical protein
LARYASRLRRSAHHNDIDEWMSALPKEIPRADFDCWSIESDTPVGRLRHMGPAVRLSETSPRWARPSLPLGYNEPAWTARAA